MQRSCFIILLFFVYGNVYPQTKAASFDCKKFFVEDGFIDAVISTNMKTLMNNKEKTENVNGVFSILLPDSSVIKEPVLMHARGNFRLEHCYIPPLKIDFKKAADGKLSALKSLKLVNGCSTGSYNDQLLLKEYLVYKIYNLLSDMSFRVRLLNLTIADENNKKKPLVIHSFFLEDMDDLAKRNHCKKWDDEQKAMTEATDRMHMAFVSVFQYMIGNTDWAVPVNHNIKLMSLKKDSVSKPFAVPYDFDYSGLVNANYAVPDELLGTRSVRDRVYRGYPRNMGELSVILKVFKEKKEQIYALIENFTQLTAYNRKEMLSYLDEFYNTIQNEKEVKRVFIDNARTN